MRARAVERSSTSGACVWVGSVTTAYYDSRGSPAYGRDDSRDPLVPSTTARVREVNAREQQQQLATAQDHRRVVVLGWPRKRATLETLAEHPEAALIQREDLDPVAATIA